MRIWSSAWVCGDFVSPLIPLQTSAVDTPQSIGSLQKLNYLSWWHFITCQLEVTKKFNLLFLVAPFCLQLEIIKNFILFSLWHHLISNWDLAKIESTFLVSAFYPHQWIELSLRLSQTKRILHRCYMWFWTIVFLTLRNLWRKVSSR